MKVVILGSGVIGVTSAYYLARDGHEVEVIDRQPGPALETSFANAGEISPGYASPWAVPGIIRRALKWMTMKHPPLIVRPVPDPHLYAWVLAMLANANPQSYARNKGRMMRLAEYSRAMLQQLRDETRIAYDARTRGTLQLFHQQYQLDAAGKDIAVLKQYGVAFELLDRAGCIAAEPGLAKSSAPIVGGLRLPGDETGDCQLFTTRLAERAAALGAVFRYNTRLTAIGRQGEQVTGVSTDRGELRGDVYVLALGSFSPIWSRRLGLHLPIYPVKGYSITVPVADDTVAPVSTTLDETYKVALTRLGARIRVGGMAELSGYNTHLAGARRDTLQFCLETLFPGAGDLSQMHFWTGMRPMTPDSTPIVGRTEIRNLFVNSGHGTLGWTMACGSARLVADLIADRTPDIEAADLGPERYWR